MPKRKSKLVVEDIYGMKVIDLKNELLSRGLDSTGKKADLVARLEDVVQGICPSGLL